jgi:hypothetical protein
MKYPTIFLLEVPQRVNRWKYIRAGGENKSHFSKLLILSSLKMDKFLLLIFFNRKLFIEWQYKSFLMILGYVTSIIGFTLVALTFNAFIL